MGQGCSLMFAERRGNALLQVAIVGAAVGALGGFAAHIASRSAATAQRVREGTTVALIKNNTKEIGRDPGFWVTQLRKNDTLNPVRFAQCLTPNPAGPWTCPPATTVTDPVVAQEALGGKTVSNVYLYDMYGAQIAGPSTAPLYYDGNGLEKAALQCPGGTTNPNCRFRSIGFMIRDNATGSPGNIIFVRKVEQSPHVVQKGVVPLAPTYDIVRVGTLWKNPAGNGLPVGSILPYSGNVVPTGYLAANGAYVAIATYPQLYAMLGTTWGPTSGAQFRLPDLRGSFLRGASTVAGGVPAVTGQQAGSTPLILAAGQTRSTSDVFNHTHPLNTTITNPAVLGVVSGSTVVSALFGGWMPASGSGGGCSGGSDWMLPAGGANPVVTGSFLATLGSPSAPTPITVTIPPGAVQGTLNTGDSAGTETRPVNVSTNFIIRADY